MLHFAYGANLCKMMMRIRCPAAAPLCTAFLPEYRLVFREYADIEPAPGATVHGALWTLTPECETALDLYEEVADGLYRRECLMVRRIAIPGETEALVYQQNRVGYEPPSEEYLDIVRQGYSDFGLDQGGLLEASRRAGSARRT